MTTKRRDELFEKLAQLSNENQVDSRIIEVVSAILNVIHVTDNTKAVWCTGCGHMKFFDPLFGQYICDYCNKKR